METQIHSSVERGRGAGMTTRLRRGSITCPYCNADCGISSTKPQSAQVTDLSVHCLNIDCSATFRWQLSLVYVICESRIENDIDLPQVPESYRRAIYTPSRAAAPDDDQIPMFAEEEEEEAAA